MSAADHGLSNGGLHGLSNGGLHGLSNGGLHGLSNGPHQTLNHVLSCGNFGSNGGICRENSGHVMPSSQLPLLDSQRYSIQQQQQQQLMEAGSYHQGGHPVTDSISGQSVYGIDYLRYWDCCGASTVSIEGKIEQALDLVKNHLMFAVREEVRLLNEEIQDLVCRNEELEYENSVLRSSATPQTLSRLTSLLSDLYDAKQLPAPPTADQPS